MDAPDNSSNFLELAVVAARSIPVAGWDGILVDLLPGTWIATSSSPTSAATLATPTAAVSTLAARWPITSDVPDVAIVVAAV